MTGPVRTPSRADQAWADLAVQLTPANSLTRIDTVTARAITTITVLGVLLTGLGALAAGQFTPAAPPRTWLPPPWPPPPSPSRARWGPRY